MFLKLAIRDEQMFKDLSQLINDKVKKVTLESLMNMMTEMMKMNQTYQQEINEMKQGMDTTESHHMRYLLICMMMLIVMSTDGHVNYTKDVAEVDEEIKDSHTNISTDGYVDVA